MMHASYIGFFRTLSNPAKLTILTTLKNGPLNVTQICKKSNLEQSRVSHNLTQLHKIGFVTKTIKGKQRIYAIDNKVVFPILEELDEHLGRYHTHYCNCSKGKCACCMVKRT